MKIFRTNLLATRFSKVNLIVAATFFTVFCVYYIIMILTNTSSDIPTHVNIAYSFAVNHDKLFPNFLYYLLVAFLSGFSKNIYIYFIVAIILLAASLTAKLLITKLYLEKYIPTHNYNKPTRLLLAIMLLFVFALPGWNLVTSHQFYLGQLTPNVWHNSTIIFLMPFAIVLFFKSYEFLFLPISPQSKKQRAEIAVLIVINALIKPSFLFTLLPAVFFIFFYHRFFTKHTTRFAQLLPYFLGIVFILGEYLLIYKLNYVSGVVQSADSSGDVGFAPFEVWRHFSNNIPLSIITSLLFPIVYIVLTGFNPFKNNLVQFAVLNFILGLAIWILIEEKGYRKFDGNFGWQLIVCNYLLFFSLLIQFIKDCTANYISKMKQLIIGTIFLLHFLWGIVYWIKIIIFKEYY